MISVEERTRMLLVVSTGLFLSIFVWFNYSAVLPLVVADWGLTGVRAGVIFGVFQAGYLAAIVPLGMLADRYSPRYVIAVGATVTGGASLAFGLLASGFVSGTVFRLIAGMGMAGVYVPGMRFVTEWYPVQARGRAMGIYIGMFSLGSGLSFLVSSAVAAAVDWQFAIIVTSLGALVVAPLILGVGRDNQTVVRAASSELSVSFLRNREYLGAVGVYTWHNWELFGVRNWLLAFLVGTPAIAMTSVPASLAGILVGAAIMMGWLGNVIGGWLSDRWGRYRTIGLALIASGSISVVIGGLDWLSLPALVVLVLLYGLVLTMDSAPTSTAITELVPDADVGTALSIQSLIGFSSTVVSPVVFGAALDLSGFLVAFPTLAVGAVIGLGFLAFLTATSNDHSGSRTQDRETA